MYSDTTIDGISPPDSKPLTESERIASLHNLNVLDTKPDAVYNRLVDSAAAVCGVPIALISLIDTDRQWFKANTGLHGVTETPRHIAFCASALDSKEILEIPDATHDKKFSSNPLVTGAPNIRFYAGAPLHLSNGAVIGTLCVIDRKPNRLTKMQRAVLENLANAASSLLDTHRIAKDLAAERSRLSATISGTGAGTWEWNIQTGEFRANDQYKSISQKVDCPWSHIDDWQTLLHPKDKAKCTKACQRHFDGHSQRYEYEGRIKLKNNNWRWVLDSGQVVSHTADGRPEWMFGTRLDINHRKKQAEALKDAHERIKLATQSGKIGVWDWNLNSNILDWNDQMFILYGLDKGAGESGSGQVGFDQWISYLHPDDRKPTLEVLDYAFQNADSYESDYRLLCPDGTIRSLRASGKITRNSKGKVTRLLGVTWDVTRLKRLSTELSEQHDLLRVTLKSIGDAVITTDAAGCVNWLNPPAEKITGWSTQDAYGQTLQNIFNIVNEDTREPDLSPLEICREHGAVVGIAKNSTLISRDGTEYGIEDSLAPIKNQNKELLGIILTFRDATEKRRLSVEMKYRATHDPLTDLINRSEFENRLYKTFSRTKRSKCTGALMYIDLDRFKLVNDSCGHSVGDELLQNISQVLSSFVGKNDTLARIGGDEFAIILQDCSDESAHHIATTICKAVDKHPFLYNGKRLRVGTSIGLVPLDKRWATVEAVLQAADSSCYAAKKSGRNRVQVWNNNDSVMQARRNDMKWASRLEQAIDQEYFVLQAQKIEPLDKKDKGLHAEVLIRMREAKGDLIEPDAFLSSAERFHMSPRIDQWVLTVVTNSLLEMKNLSSLSMLSINLSGQSVGDRIFHREAIKLLKRSGKDICQRLCLEITETVAVTNIADATVFIEQVRALGVRIALDDFGAGASSFGYLKKLNVDILKIDGQFITDLIDDPLDDVAVRCFVDVARVLGIKTVAEFVGTNEVLKRLQEIGVDYAQGFLLHQPEPIEALLEHHANFNNSGSHLS